jgi:hypothetical protein
MGIYDMKAYLVFILTLLFKRPLFSQNVQWPVHDRNGRFVAKGFPEFWQEDCRKMILSVENIGGRYSSPVLRNDD